MILKLEIKRIKKILKKIIIISVEKSLLTLILIFFFSVCLGAFVYWNCRISLVFKEEKKAIEEFNEQIYQKVFQKWQNQEEKFKDIETKEYSSPFK